MQQYETIAGSWPALTARLDRADTIITWSTREPILARASSVAELPALTARDADRAQVDGMIAALVRLAAVDGGDDVDAALVLLHLLRDGALSLAGRLRHRGPDVLALVVGELTCQIRRFPWRSTRPYGARLLLDTKHALWHGELRPLVDGRRPHEAFLVDPALWLEQPTPASEADEGVTLVDLLVWAAASGVASVEDLRLLVEFEQLRGYGNQARERVAAAWGINERTLRRRRERTLSSLRAAAAEYLAVAAA